MKPVLLEVLHSPGCQTCKQFEAFWRGIEKEWPNVTYKDLDILTPAGQEIASKYMILASPGIVINGTLWATGGFDRKKFLETLKQISE